MPVCRSDAIDPSVTDVAAVEAENSSGLADASANNVGHGYEGAPEELVSEETC